jgi:toxin YoeB
VRIELSDQAKEDIAYWNRVEPALTAKIERLLASSMQTPYSGVGKPEPLKYGLAGYWSRRIDREHRLVYKVEGDALTVASCRYHYF